MRYNKVRGIVRAKQGSQIPKFQNPSGTIQYNPNLQWNSNIPQAWDYQIRQQLKTTPSLIPSATTDPINNWTKLKNFGTQNANILQTVGKGVDTARNFLFSNQIANDSATTNTINQTYDAVSSSLMGFAPVGTIVGGAMKVGAFIGDGLQALGGGTDQMTTTDQLMDSSLFSWNIGAINGFGGKRTQDFAANKQTLEQVGGSYGGSVTDINNAVAKANKKYGLFSSGSRNKANRQIDEARRQQNIMTDIAGQASDQRAMINDLNYINHQFTLNGGYDQRYMRVAKSGMKLQDKINFIKQKRTINNVINLDTKEIEWEPIIIEEFKEGGNLPELWEPIIEDLWEPIIEDIESYKEGGKTKEELETPEIEETNQKNLIPEGALHKNKHHMEHTEGLTQKGIPVIDNDGEQQAEIELDEIIFTLEVTKKLEELYKEGTDEAAIEAGKLLVKEILFNTDDRTGLIAKCEEGGKLNDIK